MARNLYNSLQAVLLADSVLAPLHLGQVSRYFAPPQFSGVWITYTRISGHEESALDGNQNLTRPRYQFTVAGSNTDLIDAVVLALISQLNGQSYTAFAGTPEEQELSFFHDDDAEHWEESPRLYHATVDFFIMAST